MAHYTHIHKTERMEIGILLRKGYSLAKIATELGRHRSSLYRELKRNSYSRSGCAPPAKRGTYEATYAQQRAYTRRKYSKYQAMRILGDVKLRDYIDTHLRLNWSPEQIAGRLAHEAGMRSVSAPTIYTYIRSAYGRQLEYELASPNGNGNERASVPSLPSRTGSSSTSVQKPPT